MTKKNYLLVILTLACGFYSTLIGQERSKYWIFFTDKGESSTTFQKRDVVSQARLLLTHESLERRSRTWHDASCVDENDYPIVKNYIEQIEKYDIHVENQLRWFNAITAYLSLDQVREVQQLPFVREVRPVVTFRMRNQIEHPTIADASKFKKITLDSLYGYAQQQQSYIHVPEVHRRGIHGENTIIGMMDTGFRWRTNPYLMNTKVIAEYDFIFHDSVTANQPGDTVDQDEHGSETLSIIAGNIPGSYYGVAPEASFVLAKTEDIRSEHHIEEDNWAAAAEWMENLGVDVASSSLGYDIFDSGVNYTWEDGDFNGRTSIVAQAAILAARRGMLIVDAMGNEGQGDGITGTLVTPADADSIISVGAINYTGQTAGTLAGFSSTGPTNDGRIKPEVVAPGVSAYVVTPDGLVTFGSGTSFATPLVAGVAALMYSAQQTATAMMIRKAIMQMGSQASHPNNFYGWGIINAYAALSYLDTMGRNQDTSKPALTSVFQNYPNPVRTITNIPFTLHDAGHVTVRLYDLIGRLISTIVDQNYPIGDYKFPVDFSSLPSGVYFYRITVPGIKTSKKLVVIH